MGLRVSADEDVGALPVIREYIVDMKKPTDKFVGFWCICLKSEKVARSVSHQV